MNSRFPSFLRWRDSRRYPPSAFLLAAQLLSLLLYALVDESRRGRAFLGAMGVVILALVVWVIDRSPALTWVAWVLVVPGIVLGLLSTLLSNAVLSIVASLLVGYMMSDDRVTPDELFAAGATFTLLAWGFTHLYLICQIWLPGSFPGLRSPGEPRTFLELLLLSFTNLTAAGLGDILPVTPPARVLVMLEQFAGIGYIAIVVSRLIGMTLTLRKDSQES
jgi:hypothetical protein